MTNPKINRRAFINSASTGAIALGLSPFAKPVFASSDRAEGTGYLYDDRMLNHIIKPGHVECPERLIKIQEKMKRDGLDKQVVNLPFVTEPVPWIRKIHTNNHISRVQRIQNTNVATEVAVGGTLGGAKAVCEGTVRNAFCAVRPCGHHAHNSGKDEGFCYYNNVAIATKYIQQTYNIKKVLIVDWDYHHGNATQDSFYSDGSVLFCSSHDFYGYPRTGDPKMTGRGEGAGLNINIHLEPRADEDVLKRHWEQKLIPKVESFKPEFVFISAGFDSRVNDRLGNLGITDKGFQELTRIILDIAKTYAKDRLVSVLEGGYYVEGMSTAAVHHVATLLEGSTGINPYVATPKAKSTYMVNNKLYISPSLGRLHSIVITNVKGATLKRVGPQEIDNGTLPLAQLGLASGSYLATIQRYNKRNETISFQLHK